VIEYDRAQTINAAQRILDQRGWCLYEVCLDVPNQVWEPQILIFDIAAEAVADTVEAEISAEPDYDARLSGCDRCTLRPVAAMGAYLCYLADLEGVSKRSRAGRQ
jgi:hypothetical protein